MRAGQASKLAVSYENKLINSDITATQVALWNQGKASIKQSRTLKSVTIYTENNVPIIEATIGKTSRGVTQLALNTDEMQKGRVTITWNILEHNDGGVVQLIYAGNPDVSIKVDGVIEGQRQIERLEFSGKIRSPDEQYASVRQERKSTGISFLIIGLLGFIPLIALIRRTQDFIQSFLWVAGLLFIVSLVMGIYQLLRSQDIGPPFGF